MELRFLISDLQIGRLYGLPEWAQCNHKGPLKVDEAIRRITGGNMRLSPMLLALN